jgi:hypothetical protein
VKAFVLFAVASLAIVLVVGWVLTFVWPTADAARAIRTSAEIAVAVQLLAFAIARLSRSSQNTVAAWGLGTLIRVAVLVVYALVLVKAFGLQGTPALVSLALFFFLSTIVEPLLLNV